MNTSQYPHASEIMPLMPRSELVKWLKDREAEFIAHVQVAPWPRGKTSPGPYEDPYAVFDIDREQLQNVLGMCCDIPGFYAEVDRGNDDRKTVIIGKCLQDEHGHLSAESQNKAIDVLLFEVAELKAEIQRLELEIENLKDSYMSKLALKDVEINGTVPWEQIKKATQE